MNADIRAIALALGGDVAGNSVLAPGPGHSPKDRSMSVKVVGPDDFVCHSFAGDDPIECKDYVRQKLGLPQWAPQRHNENGLAHMSERQRQRDTNVIKLRTGEPLERKPFSDAKLLSDGYANVAQYDYADERGEILYQVLRYEHPEKGKTFRQRSPDGNGGWFADAGERKVLYRWNDIAKVAHNEVFICEGEKDADRVASLGFVGVTVASSNWSPEAAEALRGCECFILEDNDEPGRKKAEAAAEVLHDVAKSVRIVRLPGLGAKQDVSDWLDAGNDRDRLLDLAKAAPITKPASAVSWRDNVFTAATLRHERFPDVMFVIPDVIPEGLTILAGRPKVGKSWLGLDVCIAVAGGTYCLGDKHPEQGDVLYCALEDNRRRLQRRITKLLHVFGAKWPERLHLATSWRRIDKGGVQDLREWVADHPQARLIILDTFAGVKPIRTTQGYQEDYQSLEELHRLASETGIGIIVLHHTRKMEADDPIDTVSGTLGLAGCADCVMVINRSSQGTTLYVRGRDVEEAEHAISFDKHSCRWTILGNASEVHRSTERGKILAALEGAKDLMTPGEIMSATGMPRNNVDQLLFKMGEDGEVLKVGRGKYRHPDRADLDPR